MTKEEKIAVIYKEIANKELTFWCKVMNMDEEGVIIDTTPHPDWVAVYWEGWWITRENFKDDVTIVGHPVLLADVLNFIDEQHQTMWMGMLKYEEALFHFWLSKREPIENQSDDCIDYVYNLISSKSYD